MPTKYIAGWSLMLSQNAASLNTDTETTPDVLKQQILV